MVASGPASGSSTASLTITASPERVMAVIADFAGYPRWARAVKSCEVSATGSGGRAAQVRFRLEAGVVKDTYELRYSWADDGLAVSWELVHSNVQKAQLGSYVLRPVDAGAATHVTYCLAVELKVPLIAPLRRRAERAIIGTALAELGAEVARRP